MADITRFREALIARARDGEGKSSTEHRRAAFDNANTPASVRSLLDKVARHAYKVTDEDIAAVKAAGVSEDEIFELVVCAALGQASRQLDSGFAALDAASKAEAS